MGYAGPPAAVESCLLLASLWVELSRCLAARIDPNRNMLAAVWKLAPHSLCCPSRVCCLLRSPFMCAICGANWVILWRGWNHWDVGSGATYVGLQCCQVLPVTSPDLPVWSPKVIQFVAPLLSLGVCEWGHFSSAPR